MDINPSEITKVIKDICPTAKALSFNWGICWADCNKICRGQNKNLAIHIPRLGMINIKIALIIPPITNNIIKGVAKILKGII